MFTRCPACAASYELSLAALAEAAGVVRCGNCGKTFNSLANLFGHQPEADATPLRGQGMPPVLRGVVLLQPNLPGLEPPEWPEARHDQAMVDRDGRGSQAPAAPRVGRTPWPGVAALLALLALGQGTWLLVSRDEAAGSAESQPGQPSAPGLVLVGRDLHQHPSLDDAAVISALLRNPSGNPVRIPIIELRLFDRNNLLVGIRRLSPGDDFGHTGHLPATLPPGALLPIIVEVALDGAEADSFDLRFF